MKTLTFLFLMSLFTFCATAQTFEDIIGTKQNKEVGSCAATDVNGNLLVGGYMLAEMSLCCPYC